MLNPDLVPSIPGVLNVSPANFWPETRADLRFPPSIRILDSTLRKTYFTAGNATSQAGFVRIAEALVDLGVTDTCLNVTWSGDTTPTPQDWQLMQTVLRADLPLRVNVWSDVLLGNGRDPLPIPPSDGLRRLADAGARFVAPGIVPAPDADAAARQMDQLDAHLDEARSLGLTTTITLAQVGLRDFDELVRVSRRAAQGGAARLDLMDSTSSMSPDAMRRFVRRFRAEIHSDVPITMHVHDEFGLATASALAAASEGAAPDVSMNGMSYRAGFAPLEEVVLALEVLHGVDTGIDLSRIAEVSRIVAEESGIAVPPLKPLTGGYAHLKHMPGDAAQAISRGARAFPPISHGIVPAVTGSSLEWVWGSASSLAQTHELARECGEELTADEAAGVRASIDACVAEIDAYPRWLTPDEARAVLVRSVRSLRGGTQVPALGDVLRAAIPDDALAHDALAALGGNAYVAVPDDTFAAVAAAVEALSTGRLIDLLATFNRFGENAGARPEQSEREERALLASERAERDELAALALTYERRFGFRAVYAADGRSAAQISALVRASLAQDAVMEIARARRAAADILTARIRRSAAQ